MKRVLRNWIAYFVDCSGNGCVQAKLGWFEDTSTSMC